MACCLRGETCYPLSYGCGAKKGFEIYFVIVPEPDLLVRVKSKDTGKKSKYRFHFKLSGDNKKVHDIRESSTKGPDYSGYLNAWDLIKAKLK